MMFYEKWVRFLQQSRKKYPPEMTHRLTALLTSATLLFGLSANAQFLSQETPSGQSVAEFNKRMPRKQEAIANATLRSEMLGWNLFRNELLRDAASYALASQEGAMSTSGSIVIPGDQWRVRFYQDQANGSEAPVADVLFDNDLNSTIVPQGAVSPLSEEELAMIRAQKLIDLTQALSCEGDYTTIVMKAPDGQTGYYVYSIRKSEDFNHLPEGQHVLYEVSANGTTITAKHEFATRCNMPSIGLNTPEDERPQFRQSYTMDSQPTEIHVYLSLRYNISLFIATMPSNLYWAIDNGSVRMDD